MLADHGCGYRRRRAVIRGHRQLRRHSVHTDPDVLIDPGYRAADGYCDDVVLPYASRFYGERAIIGADDLPGRVLARAEETSRLMAAVLWCRPAA